MFAHGQGELRTGHARIGGRQEQVISSPQYKTVLCQQKNCLFAESCCFAHGQGELRTVQQNLAQMNPNYKVTLCKYYMTTGKCEFGSFCQNAHGQGELRTGHTGTGGRQEQVISSPQYKTVLCQQK